MRTPLLLIVASLSAVRSDIVLKVVSPVDLDTFPSAAYTAVVNTFASAPCTILSMQPDTITGFEAKRTYFPNITGVYSFQLIHITRVTTLVPTTDSSTTTQRLQLQLAPACATAGVGQIAIDMVSNPSQVDWLSDLPPSVVISLAIGWMGTTILCGAGWLIFYFCCCKRQQQQNEEHTEEEKVPAAIVLQPGPPPNGIMPPQTTKTNALIMPIMRLPDALAKTAGQCDPYAAPEGSAGPCAIRLASLCKHPAPKRP